MAERVMWGEHEMYVCSAPGEMNWKAAGGVYIFAGLGTSTDGQSVWYAHYIGKTGDLADRLADHEKWTAAKELGATHVHARVVEDSRERNRVETDLIGQFQPTLNSQGR